MANFGSKNDGKWFYFDEENEDAGGVCLRILSTDAYADIEKLTVKQGKPIFHKGQKFDNPVVNEKLASKMRWRYCIVDWKNVQIDGQDVECNDENKAKLIKVNDFISFVATCLEELTETNDALEEARVKNSETSSSGNADPVE